MDVGARGGHVGVAQELLDRGQVLARLHQVRGEAVAEAVERGALGQLGLAHGLPEGTLEARGMQVVAALDARLGVDRRVGRREQPEPRPRAIGAGQLAG